MKYIKKMLLVVIATLIIPSHMTAMGPTKRFSKKIVMPLLEQALFDALDVKRDIKPLLAHVNPNITSAPYNLTPIHVAALKAHDSAIRDLHKAGGLPNPVDIFGQGPAHLTAQFKPQETQEFLEGKAAHNIIDALHEIGVNINARDIKRRTPLMTAASEGNYPVVEALLKHKPDLDAQDDDGDTALHKAARKPCISSLELLLKHGARQDLPNERFFLPREHNTHLPRLAALFDKYKTGTPQATSDQPKLDESTESHLTFLTKE
ncbi:MAG: ankyrin repeat domain-containing protein [Candidatus Dependentiae bacterium]|nr:ankyrin repeat domain-containing protein [Candidatus Dependentiae bacterium]